MSECECEIVAVHSTIIGDGTVNRKLHRCPRCVKRDELWPELVEVAKHRRSSLKSAGLIPATQYLDDLLARCKGI